MNTKQTAIRWIQRALLCLLAGLTVTPARPAVSLASFGYKRIDPGSSSRPLLVVLGDFDCFAERRMERSVDYYRKLFFDRNTYPSLNGFLWENSLGRFQFTPAGPGVVGPFVMSTNESWPYIVSKYPLDCETVYYSNVIRRVINSKLLDIPSFDKNGNRKVETGELSFTFMNNYGGGASRAAPPVSIPGTSYTVGGCWESGVFPVNCFITANFSHGDLESMVHEQLHQLGLLDLYGRLGLGCPNGNFSTMACTLPTDDVQDTKFWYFNNPWNLDPWNRMLLGWCEPRLVSLTQGGRFTLPAAQLHQGDGPILLYNPNTKYMTNDYFLLEYRTPNTRSAGPGYDAKTGTAGLVIWHFHPDDPTWHVPFVHTEGPPDFVAGSAASWSSGSTTPNLRHRPNENTNARIYIYPFPEGADSIDIEILVHKETYVDFSSTVTPEAGSYSAPYNSLAEGVANASWGGTILFRGGGNTAERMRIDKAVTLKTYGAGFVTLGR